MHILQHIVHVEPPNTCQSAEIWTHEMKSLKQVIMMTDVSRVGVCCESSLMAVLALKSEKLQGVLLTCYTSSYRS